MTPTSEQTAEERRMCKRHRPKSKTMGYAEHMKWMDGQQKLGHRQKKCRVCGYYFFRCEL